VTKHDQLARAIADDTDGVARLIDESAVKATRLHLIAQEFGYCALLAAQRLDADALFKQFNHGTVVAG
jgi:hypothetical protein